MRLPDAYLSRRGELAATPTKVTLPASTTDSRSVSRWRELESDPNVDLSRALLGYAAQVVAARNDRLNAEALALLKTGVLIEDLVVVYSPTWPHGRVMTREQERAHAEEMRRSRGW